MIYINYILPQSSPGSSTFHNPDFHPDECREVSPSLINMRNFRNLDNDPNLLFERIRMCWNLLTGTRLLMEFVYLQHANAKKDEQWTFAETTGPSVSSHAFLDVSAPSGCWHESEFHQLTCNTWNEDVIVKQVVSQKVPFEEANHNTFWYIL